LLTSDVVINFRDIIDIPRMAVKKKFSGFKWIALGISGMLIITLITLTLTNKNVIRKAKVLTIEYRTIHYSDEITEIDSAEVAPIVYDFQTSLANLPPVYRKEKFIDLILPAILVTKYEIQKEHVKASQIWSRMRNNYPVSHSDSVFILGLTRKYQTNNLYEILKKQQVHPNSIIIAQAALESGWGTSRFFGLGNNLFGIWSYNSSDPRVNSLIDRNEQKIYLRKYNTVKDCIEDYFLTIANSWAYTEFREKRLDVENPLALIWYLSQYSELRYEYVKKLGELMIQNDLQKYDEYKLSDDFMVELNIK
jgi:Bax protein